MSNVHVLQVVGNSVVVALHIDTPAGTNQAGLTYPVVIGQTKAFPGTTVLPDGAGASNDGTISATEKAQLAAFTRVEIVKTFTPQPGQTLGQVGTALDAYYTSESAIVQADIQARLKFSGITR